MFSVGSSTMLSPLISWILPSSSSSSSSSSAEEEQSLDSTTNESDHDNDNVTNEDNDPNDNVNHDQNDDHYFSSCDVDDDTITVALAIPNASPVVTVAFPTTNERNTITTTTTTIMTHPKRQRNERITNYYRLGKQYQRLWTKQNEIELLKGYLDYIKQHRKGTTTLQNDVALLYDHVRPKLNMDFNKNQLVEKLHRLKRKHKVSMDKVNLASGSSKEVSFKNLQDKAIFEISDKIWGNDKDQDGFDSHESSPVTESHDLGKDNLKMKNERVENNCDEIDSKVPKRLRLCNNHKNGDNAMISIQGLIEETMMSCFSPLVKEVLDNAQEGSVEGLEVKPMPLCCGELRERRILELEVYLNRLELLQGQIKARLEELKSG